MRTYSWIDKLSEGTNRSKGQSISEHRHYVCQSSDIATAEGEETAQVNQRRFNVPYRIGSTQLHGTAVEPQRKKSKSKMIG